MVVQKQSSPYALLKALRHSPNSTPTWLKRPASATAAVALQASATRTPEGLAAKTKLNKNLSRNSQAAKAAVDVQASAARTESLAA